MVYDPATRAKLAGIYAVIMGSQHLVIQPPVSGPAV
jgi:hypothetical protein